VVSDTANIVVATSAIRVSKKIVFFFKRILKNILIRVLF